MLNIKAAICSLFCYLYLLKKRIHTKIIKQQLSEAQNNSLKLNVILIANKCCSECDMIDKKIITMEEAMLKLPIPHEKCIKEGGCSCAIGFVPIHDKNGVLIKR